MTDAAWGTLSNQAVAAAAVVYFLALLAHVVEWSSLRQVDKVQAVLVGPGGGEVAPPTPSPRPDVERQQDRVAMFGRLGLLLTGLAVAVHLVALVARGMSADPNRVPWGNMYEFVLVCALAAGGAYLAFLTREPVRTFGVWIVGVVLLALGLAVTVLYVPSGGLVPVLDSYWLVIHVAAAIAGGGVFTVGAIATALFLVRQRHERRGSDSPASEAAPRRQGYAAILPPAERLEQVAHAAHMFAFPIWTFAVIAGAIWAENSWGRYWGWDPKETWAFITWVFYAAHLHAQATAGWRGVRAAWFALLGYAAFLFNFFGVNLWISGLHSYSGV